MYCVAMSVLPWEMGRRLVYCHGQDIICPFASSEDNTGSLSIYAHRLANSSTMVVNLMAANQCQAYNKTKLIFLWLPCTTKKNCTACTWIPHYNHWTHCIPKQSKDTQPESFYCIIWVHFLGDNVLWNLMTEIYFNHSIDIWLHPL